MNYPLTKIIVVLINFNLTDSNPLSGLNTSLAIHLLLDSAAITTSGSEAPYQGFYKVDKRYEYSGLLFAKYFSWNCWNIGSASVVLFRGIKLNCILFS